MSAIKSALTRCPLFQGLDSLDFLNGPIFIRTKNCLAGEQLELTIGGKRCFGLVVSGSVNSDYLVCRRGQCFGLCFAMTGSEHGSYVAGSKAQVMLIPAELLLGGSGLDAEIENRILSNALAMVSKELDEERMRTSLLTVHGIRQRLAAYLRLLYEQTGSPYLTIPFNRNRLAAFLSVSRPSMSRELCALRDLGVLEFEGSSVKILDPSGL